MIRLHKNKRGIPTESSNSTCQTRVARIRELAYCKCLRHAQKKKKSANLALNTPRFKEVIRRNPSLHGKNTQVQKRLQPGLKDSFYFSSQRWRDSSSSQRAESRLRRRRLEGERSGDKTEAKGDEELPTRLSINFRRRLRCTTKHSTLSACLPASLRLMYNKVL